MFYDRRAISLRGVPYFYKVGGRYHSCTIFSLALAGIHASGAGQLHSFKSKSFEDTRCLKSRKIRAQVAIGVAQLCSQQVGLMDDIGCLSFYFHLKPGS